MWRLRDGGQFGKACLLNVETITYMKSPREAASKIDPFIAKLRTASDTARPYVKSKLNALSRRRRIR